MSVEEIVRYVRQTPGNTNPSVVGSMVNAEMNETLKAAKKYTDSQRLGYTEKKTLKLSSNKTITVPFTKDELIGLEITEEKKNLWWLKTPSKRPTNREQKLDIFYSRNSSLSQSIFVGYSNMGGLADKYCLGINLMGDQEKGNIFYCPSLYNSGYDTLVYVYEETSVSSIATLKKGWYALNTTDFSHIQIDLKDYYCLLNQEDISNGQMYNEEYFKECFSNESITYVVEPNNIYDLGNDVLAITYVNLTNFTDGLIYMTTFLGAIEYDTLKQAMSISNGSFYSDKKITITYPQVYPIETKYLPKGGFGYTEPNVLTYDGNVNDRTHVTNQIYLVKVLDKAIDLNTVTNVVFTTKQFTVTFRAKDGTLKVIGADPEQKILNATFEDVEGPMIMTRSYGDDHPLTGTYLCGFDKMEVGGTIGTLTGWVSYVEYGEKAHQIDQKFIPGLLPVVELTTPYPIEEESTTVPLTKKESAQLQVAAETGLPAIISFTVSADTSVRITDVFQYVKIPIDGAVLHQFVCTMPDANVNFSGVNGEWTAKD